MEWLNYHHLYYFWTVARRGTVSAASEELKLAQPTVSAQLRALEDSFQVELFERQGRRLKLTDAGQLVFRYAEEIFSLGRELRSAVHGRPIGRALQLNVGIADFLPKFIAFQLLKPALELSDKVSLVCKEDKPERLISELALHTLDVVLSDSPVPPGVSVKAFSHLLGESAVSFFAVPKLATKFRRRFPRSLDNAPFLYPLQGATLRRDLDQWFDARGIRPDSVGEFEDRALLKIFGQSGIGIFAAPSVIEAEIRRQYDVSVIGRTDEIIERFYAISIERRIKHPAVLAISTSAKADLFA